METYTPIKLIPEEQQFERKLRKDKRKKNLKTDETIHRWEGGGGRGGRRGHLYIPSKDTYWIIKMQYNTKIDFLTTPSVPRPPQKNLKMTVLL
jgi:hypothetical protein